MKKKILGMSDAWSTIRLSHWPSEPVYYIVDCRISDLISICHSQWCFFLQLFLHFCDWFFSKVNKTRDRGKEAQWGWKVKKIGGATSNGWTESAPYGWNRVSWYAKYWGEGGSGPPGPPVPASLSPLLLLLATLETLPHKVIWNLSRFVFKMD